LLVSSWHRRRLDSVSQTQMRIGGNFIDAKDTLPATSIVNSTILSVASEGMCCILTLLIFYIKFVGLLNTNCAQAFGVSRKSIYNAKRTSTPPFAHLTLPPRRRDKLRLKRPLLEKYFARAKVRSGNIFFSYWSVSYN
jgi:hypothetical protein